MNKLIGLIQLGGVYKCRTLARTYTAQEKAAREAVKKFSKKSQLKPVTVRAQMTVLELAQAMNKPVEHVHQCLAQLNYGQIRQKRDSSLITNFDVIVKVVQLSGFRYQMPGPQEVNFEQLEQDLRLKDDTREKRARPDAKSLIKRPPVVTIMGHVDHGKTTLLDSLRGTHMVEKEFGGITQHIGAFNCRLASLGEQRNITFLDTPGHAAFSMMRSRGARLTDIIVLVIAADDGIMAQTVESIQHAKSTGCPIIVAINKIDKCSPQQIERVKQQLLSHDLIPEEMGGDVQIVPISALAKKNLDLLKEEIWAQAEVMELRGDPKGLVEGYVIESSQDLHKGKLATVLIQRGTLTRGAYLVAGPSWCKVKFMFDENSANVPKATLSQAVQVMGWKDMPKAGDEVLQVDSEHRAKEIAELRHKIDQLKKEKHDSEVIKKKRLQHEQFYKSKLQERRLSGSRLPVSLHEQNAEGLNDLPTTDGKQPNSEAKQAATIRTLHIIVKTDVNGSLEAILNVLETYNAHHLVKLDLVHFEVGPVKKSDIELAEMFDAVIYCFNLPVNRTVESTPAEVTSKHATADGKHHHLSHGVVKIRHFNVIYKLFDDLKAELAELAPFVEQEAIVGEADVMKVFEFDESNKKTILVAGGRCTEGHLDKKMNFRLMRDNQCVFDRQSCKSLKHLKNDVNTIKRNVEFGFAFADEQIRPQSGDKIICYEIKQVKSPIEWDLGF